MSPLTLSSVPRLRGGRPATALSLHVHADAASGAVGRLGLALGRLEGSVPGLEAFAVQTPSRAGGSDLTVYVARPEHEMAVRALIGRLEGFEVLDLEEGGTVLGPTGGAVVAPHAVAS